MSCHWLGVVIDKDVFKKALELLPTQEEGVYARDELIQLCTIIAEVDPLLTRCTARLARETEEAMAEKGKSKSKM